MIANLKKIFEEELSGQYTVEVADLLEHPYLAEGEQVIAVPTLIKRLPVRCISQLSFIRQSQGARRP